MRVARYHVPYDLWHQQGLLETTEGNVVQYAHVERHIEQLGTRFDIREIAFDRWGAVQMSQNLDDAGFTVVPFGQGFKDMSPPSKEQIMKLLDWLKPRTSTDQQIGGAIPSSSAPPPLAGL